jgi:hypothetical protein
VGRPPLHPLHAIAPLLSGALVVTVAGCALLEPPVAPHASRLSRTPEPLAIPPTDPPDEVPTPRPEASGNGPDIEDAANALADLDSYRVTVVVTGLVPSSTPDGSVSMTSTITQGALPAAQFTIVGADGLEGGHLQAIVIGDEAWLRSGNGRWIKSPGGAADFDAAFTSMSPIDLATGFESLSPILQLAREETKNGIGTMHYRVLAADPAAAAAGLTSGSAEVWLATKHRYLVSLAVAGEWDVDGTPTPVSLRIDVSRVNDPSNDVRPPA